jgi:hypothetical protein
MQDNDGHVIHRQLKDSVLLAITVLGPAPPSSTTPAESGPTVTTPVRSSSSDPSFMTRHLVSGYRELRQRAALDTAVKISEASTSMPASVRMAAISRRDFEEVFVTRPKPIPSFRSHASVSAAPVEPSRKQRGHRRYQAGQSWT